MPSFNFFQKAVFGQRYFLSSKIPFDLLCVKFLAPSQIPYKLCCFSDLFINHFLNPLYHLDGLGFCFVCLLKHQCIISDMFLHK